MNRLPRLRRLAPSLALRSWPAAFMVVGCVETTDTPKAKIRYTSIAKDKSLPALLDGTIYERTHTGQRHPLRRLGVRPDRAAPRDRRLHRAHLRPQLHVQGDRPAQVRRRHDPRLRQHQLRRRPEGPALRDRRRRRADPPGHRKDDWIDVRVSCLPNNNTKSLAHGVLFETDLKNAGANRDNPGGAVNSFVRVQGAGPRQPRLRAGRRDQPHRAGEGQPPQGDGSL